MSKGYVTTKKTGRADDSYTRRLDPHDSRYKNLFENILLEGEAAKIFNGCVVRIISQVDPESCLVGFYRPYLVNRAISAGCTEDSIRELQSMKTDNSFDEVVMEVDSAFVRDRDPDSLKVTEATIARSDEFLMNPDRTCQEMNEAFLSRFPIDLLDTEETK